MRVVSGVGVDARVSEISNLLANGDAAGAFSRGRRLLAEKPGDARLAYLVGSAALQSQDYPQAVEHLKAANELQADTPEICNNLGAALLHTGRLDAAISSLRRAVDLRPDYHNAKVNLAVAFKQKGLFEDAEAQLSDVQRTSGDTVDLVAEFADLFRLQERWSEAADAYLALHENDPADPEPLERAAEAMIRSGDVQGAAQMVLSAPAGRKDDGAVLARCGDLFLKNANTGIATRLFRLAVGEGSADMTARLGLAEVYRQKVARWHFSMLNDTVRNAAYDDAIKRAVKPGDIVLDIGTGTGLLAMMAARAGAGHVYTCECVPLIAEKAKHIIAANGYQDRISVVSKWSHEMSVPQDMPEPADVLVSEIVDNLLIGEGVMATLDHALNHLVKPEGKVIPTAGGLYAVPVECGRLFERDRCDTAAGFDVSAFNEFTAYGNFSSDMVRGGDYRELGPAVKVFSFDFCEPGYASEVRDVELTCTNDGTLHGAMIWFELIIDDLSKIDNHPERGHDHWGCSFCFLPEPRTVKAGTSLSMVAQHDTTAVDFHFL